MTRGQFLLHLIERELKGSGDSNIVLSEKIIAEIFATYLLRSIECFLRHFSNPLVFLSYLEGTATYAAPSPFLLWRSLRLPLATGAWGKAKSIFPELFSLVNGMQVTNLPRINRNVYTFSSTGIEKATRPGSRTASTPCHCECCRGKSIHVSP